MVDLSRRDDECFEQLIYSKFDRRRFTQDSPILLDVYTHYGCEDVHRQDLLLTPDWARTPGELAARLQSAFGIAGSDDGDDGNEDAQNAALAERERELAIAFNQSVVAISLTFRELVTHVLPLSWWWNHWLVPIAGATPTDVLTGERTAGIARAQLRDGLAHLIAERERAASDARSGQPADHWLIRDDLVATAHLFFLIEHSNRADQDDDPADDPDAIASWFVDLVRDIPPTHRLEGNTPWVFSVNRNRPIHRTTRKSVPATKADVAWRTFDVRGDGISWAVVDAGIDATHIAFRRRDPSTGHPYATPFGGGNRTRIAATYDFSRIREHLTRAQRRALRGNTGKLLDWETLEKTLVETVEVDGRQVTRPLLKVSHDEHYRVPTTTHGTHVAGIIGADWDPALDDDDPIAPTVASTRPSSPIVGMAPDIELYDLRVFDGDRGDEFAVMSALQFVRSLNLRSDAQMIHGVNLSLSVYHDVANFACGRSPVCEESTRLVNSGVVVVAAAGNDGRAVYTSTQGRIERGYRTVSIADPGNAEAVITVGATHRSNPYEYGVSYFSSRGPTGDGRMKPDLVAPGEKIYSTVPGDRFERQDGTSQAAPHVSGAAALLMSRNQELVGDPLRVKRILMDSATDLGRERTYQGAGLVDVMRAIQST